MSCFTSSIVWPSALGLAICRSSFCCFCDQHFDSHLALRGLPACLPTCSNNRLQQLLPGISALQSLRMLDLSDNPLGPTLPEDVAMLPSLATLNCNSCGLQQLPAALGGAQQPNLSAISACSNQLSCLPEGLSAASALVVLKASHNQLQELPGRLVRGWRSLKELDLAHNKLQVRLACQPGLQGAARAGSALCMSCERHCCSQHDLRAGPWRDKQCRMEAED